ncbi:hypothetical protein SK128_023605 [Halocaridina rubra]|uniref:Uncharacterized protein n=1 Tax=Halocaridina rubra TaxID=373956 RepID=A0AAN8ZSP0_HALRR
MKEAKTVRVGEEPYKIVKARPKWDRNTCQVVKDRPLEVFGEWQVEDYEPPIATGGKVPRNEYGNVELFKPSMLPRGCVHLPINGLNRIARKLNIDCAPAMVGFDFHSGWTHPVYEGYVVCEEFKDTLLDAWNQDQAEQARREEEKRQKRIYNNWKRLIQGLLIRDRVQKKYGNALVADEEAAAAKEDNPQGIKQKSKGKSKSVENMTVKRKVTQDDINAARTHTTEKTDMKIDLTSSVVEMAKASRKKAMKTSNAVRREVLKNDAISHPLGMREKLDDSSDETDEEEKKQKIRAILQWGSAAVTSSPDLSDDSDVEGKAHSSVSRISLLNKLYIDKDRSSPVVRAKSKTKKRGRNSKMKMDNDDEESSLSDLSNRSTTPELCDNSPLDTGRRRLSRRSLNKKTVVYNEGDEDEDDISISESDIEDKTYNPL